MHGMQPPCWSMHGMILKCTNGTTTGRPACPANLALQNMVSHGALLSLCACGHHQWWVPPITSMMHLSFCLLAGWQVWRERPGMLPHLFCCCCWPTGQHQSLLPQGAYMHCQKHGVYTLWQQWTYSIYTAKRQQHSSIAVT